MTSPSTARVHAGLAPARDRLRARDDGEGVLFDGTAPLLATPYYWAYIHALSRLNPDGSTFGMWKALAWVATSSTVD